MSGGIRLKYIIISRAEQLHALYGIKLLNYQILELFHLCPEIVHIASQSQSLFTIKEKHMIGLTVEFHCVIMSYIS